jgi:hypothetical protein
MLAQMTGAKSRWGESAKRNISIIFKVLMFPAMGSLLWKRIYAHQVLQFFPPLAMKKYILSVLLLTSSIQDISFAPPPPIGNRSAVLRFGWPSTRFLAKRVVSCC